MSGRLGLDQSGAVLMWGLVDPCYRNCSVHHVMFSSNLGVFAPYFGCILVVIATQSLFRLVKDFLAAKILSFFVDITRLD